MNPLNLQTLRAHTRNPDGGEDFLYDHLVSVAGLAKDFAKPFGASDLAYLLGLWHDLGKVNPQFQSYLDAQEKHESHPKVRHAIWGAAFAYWFLWKQKGLSESWKETSLPIGGHHGGLNAADRYGQDLERFLEQKDPFDLLRQAVPQLPSPSFTQSFPKDPGRRDLFIRMLFSALVDADYLATERHFDSRQAHLRGRWPSLKTLWKRMQGKQKTLLGKAARNPTQVNQVRREVYEACLVAAEQPQGVFRLTVPTGGGKTRSSLAFALKHALKCGLRRVIVGIPYTSIIDQTADEYRKVLGRKAVIEHHSQVQVNEKEGEEQEPYAVRLRLATENWDAPLIVTTTVQLFESLFGNRPGAVRKIHNLANSVIILDEVQTLPTELLKPTLDVLRALVEDYGVSIVLSTATQPAFDNTPYLDQFDGLEIREIVPSSQYKRHFAKLKRVQYEIHKATTWDDLAAEVKNCPQVMIVLNTRKDALTLLDIMADTKGICHLSTLLCCAHRRKVLRDVRRKLNKNLPVCLVSTQVVEAGVDIDFPVVYRAIGPLDRIVQAAGRCNREQKRDFGRVVIFEPANGGSPRGPYKIGTEQAKSLLNGLDPERLHDPDLYRTYFQGLFSGVDLDAKHIQEFRRALDYPTVAERYKLIEQATAAVVVPYEDAAQRLDSWQKHPCQSSWRALQPYLVNVFMYEAEQLLAEDWLRPVNEGLYEWLGKYDALRGIRAEYDPSDLYVGQT